MIQPTSDSGSRQPSRADALVRLDDIDLVFDALSAPARRQILLVLHARGGTMTSKEVAERFTTTWATTSRHLGTLERAGLVRATSFGRERRYELIADRLTNTVGAWIEHFDH